MLNLSECTISIVDNTQPAHYCFTGVIEASRACSSSYTTRRVMDRSGNHSTLHNRASSTIHFTFIRKGFCRNMISILKIVWSHQTDPSYTIPKQQVKNRWDSGSHSGEHKDDCLLGCCDVLSWCLLEAANTSETSVNFYQTTRRNNPEDSHLQVKNNSLWSSIHGFHPSFQGNSAIVP
jgi:hypothetical protein